MSLAIQDRWRSGLGVLLVAAVATLGGCSNRDAGQSGAGAVDTSKGAGPEPAAASPRPVAWSAVDEALGRPGEVMAGDVHRYGFPRSDLKVTLDGVALKPGFALGSYAAFLATGDDVMVMGDLVLTETEVSPVMAKLQEQDLEVSAVHNHLLREAPKVMYMHYLGHGEDAVTLARALQTALQMSATPLGAPQTAASSGEADLGFDAGEIDRIIGRAGKTTGGLHKYSIARAETVLAHMGRGQADPGSKVQEVQLTPALGVGTVINFQPLGDGRAAITGDFALIGSEVAEVASTLRAEDIEVTAVHTHMTNDDPSLYYLHFFATGAAADLAAGLRAALDLTNSARA